MSDAAEPTPTDNRPADDRPADDPTENPAPERGAADPLASRLEPDDPPPAEPGDAEPDDDAPKGKGKDQWTQADRVIELALNRYRFGRSERGDPFAVEQDGPALALTFRGRGLTLKSQLASAYFQRHGRVPSGAALADAIATLQGVSLEHDPEPVELRAARHGESVVIDLGDPRGRCVLIDPSGWRVAPRSPVLFRRTELVGPMPEPTRGGSLDALRELVNVGDGAWTMLVGWTLTALIPSYVCPVLTLSGEQGAAKSTCAAFLADLLDPGPAPLRPAPKDAEAWALTASAGRVLAVDNISGFPAWWSDALCRTVTGDSLVRRALYADEELTVLRFQRPVILNGIELAATRGDLAERCVVLDLERIDPKARRSGDELRRTFEAVRPGVLGALFDLLARVLAQLPEVRLDTLPRMADFARVLAALDEVTGWSSLETYLAQGRRAAEDVLDASPLGRLVIRFIAQRTSHAASATDLHAQLLDAHCGDGDRRQPQWFPKTPAALGRELSRLAPSLREQGVEISRVKDGSQGRVWKLDADPDAFTFQPDSVGRPGPAAPGAYDHDDPTIPFGGDTPE